MMLDVKLLRISFPKIWLELLEERRVMWSPASISLFLFRVELCKNIILYQAIVTNDYILSH